MPGPRTRKLLKCSRCPCQLFFLFRINSVGTIVPWYSGTCFATVETFDCRGVMELCSFPSCCFICSRSRISGVTMFCLRLVVLRAICFAWPNSLSWHSEFVDHRQTISYCSPAWQERSCKYVPKNFSRESSQGAEQLETELMV